MQTLTIQTQISKLHDVEIPVPSFYRDKDEQRYLALLDEKTCIKMFNINEFVSMSTGHPDTFKSDIVEAWQTFHACTQAEFLAKYDSIIESMHPALKA